MRIKIAFIAFIFLTVSCNSDIVVSETRAIHDTWGKDAPLVFEIAQLDSLKKYNVFLHVRNSNQYKYNNLFLIASIQMPHGKTITDTLEYRMANSDGSWIGTGLGSVKENKFWYKENVSFKEEGTYLLTIHHAVRNNGDVEGVKDLVGITDAGFSIEEVSRH